MTSSAPPPPCALQQGRSGCGCVRECGDWQGGRGAPPRRAAGAAQAPGARATPRRAAQQRTCVWDVLAGGVDRGQDELGDHNSEVYQGQRNDGVVHGRALQHLGCFALRGWQGQSRGRQGQWVRRGRAAGLYGRMPCNATARQEASPGPHLQAGVLGAPPAGAVPRPLQAHHQRQPCRWEQEMGRRGGPCRLAAPPPGALAGATAACKACKPRQPANQRPLTVLVHALQRQRRRRRLCHQCRRMRQHARLVLLALVQGAHRAVVIGMVVLMIVQAAGQPRQTIRAPLHAGPASWSVAAVVGAADADAAAPLPATEAAAIQRDADIRLWRGSHLASLLPLLVPVTAGGAAAASAPTGAAGAGQAPPCAELPLLLGVPLRPGAGCKAEWGALGAEPTGCLHESARARDWTLFVARSSLSGNPRLPSTSESRPTATWARVLEQGFA